MAVVTPIKIRMACIDAAEKGVCYKKIYETIYLPSMPDDPMPYRSFSSNMARWRKSNYASLATLNAGTYEGFTAHNATVQVSRDGQVVQAWIKQSADAVDPNIFIEAVKKSVEPYEYVQVPLEDAHNMLEIPLFDMHWGINDFKYYQPVLDEILDVINSKNWHKIVIPFGQDFFHNDSVVKGETTKGTKIDKVDMQKAVEDGKRFMFAIIEAAINKAREVNVFYSCGNHDCSMSWMFVQVLKERYGKAIVDDSIENRKCVAYGQTAIMYTHGDSKQATAKNLAHIFPIAFPQEFAFAKVREVHAGHLHHEAEADIFGVMVRRLSSGTATDDWTDKEDFVGAHKRFMLFEYSPAKLRAIYYI